MKLLVFLTLQQSMRVFAAGGGHHGSPVDLIFPAINVILLASFFIWKLGPKTKSYFRNRHKEVKESASRAQAMQAEAKQQLESQEKKNSSLGSTIKEIQNSAQEEIAIYRKEKENENEKKIEKLSKDAEEKIAMQKDELLKGLNNELLDLIISKAKSKVSTEKDLQKSIASNLIKGL